MHPQNAMGPYDPADCCRSHKHWSVSQLASERRTTARLPRNPGPHASHLKCSLDFTWCFSSPALASATRTDPHLELQSWEDSCFSRCLSKSQHQKGRNHPTMEHWLSAGRINLWVNASYEFNAGCSVSLPGSAWSCPKSPR